MSSSASTDTFPALPADVAEVRRAAGITIAPEAALHRALQERTDELERVRAELHEARATLAQLTAPPTAPDVGSTTSAPAAGAADPPRPRLMAPHPSERVIAWSRTVFGG